MSVEVEIHRVPGAEDLPLPSYETAQAAGCDLRAAVDGALTLAPGAWAVVPCGIALALPEGFEAQVRPRSGLAARFGVTVLNAPGTIDADYRGEIKVPLINHGPRPFEIRRGDRVAQLIVAPVLQVRWREVASLDATARGHQGFGSTGR